jgi:hypothetical protein
VVTGRGVGARRRIGRQLDRGEALNDLRRFIFFAHRGAVRYPHHDDQTTQALCHTLVVNACIYSTTCYLQDAINAHKADGHHLSDAAIAHLSPAHFEAIKPLRHAQLRRRQRPQTASPSAPQLITRVSSRLRLRFGAVTQ